ncbi:MAG: 3'-5' exonuclease, partial [Candidatus Binatia bacterium]
FYAAQEVIDAVNLLRSVENPYDKPALVGVLRSPIGGLTDAEIYALHRQGLLQYQSARRASGDTAKSLDCIKDLYEILDRLHATTRVLPVGEAVNLIFDTIPIRILTSQSFNGEQAVANLEKVREQAGLLGREGIGTLKEVVGTLERRVLDLKEEGESALAEEDVDAVRILSVHKAKGLEFPVVVLADAGGTMDQRETGIWVQYDWSTKLTGLRIRDYCNLEGVFLAEKGRLREEEEQKRVFYVAMTRAREHLTISCAPQAMKKSDGSFYSLLQDCLTNLSPGRKAGPIAAGKGKIEYISETQRLAAPKRKAERGKIRTDENDWESYARLWDSRKQAYDAVRQTPVFLTPTLLKRGAAISAEAATDRAPGNLASDQAALIGILAHRFLQGWDFSADPGRFEEKLASFMDGRPEGVGNTSDMMQRELREIFRAFFSGEAFAELSTARILGREVPFLMPWNGQIMEGVIDLIYEKDDRLYLADYKTDRFASKPDLLQKAQEYYHQARIYSAAVQQCLRREVTKFRLIFLRVGEAVDVPLNQGALQYTLPF